MTESAGAGHRPADIAGRAAALRERLGGSGRGAAPIVRAPGRVNLIGEYTDINSGFVLPVAIDREVWIAFVPWERGEVELMSVAFAETRAFHLGSLSPATRQRSWIDYPASAAWSMREAGLPVRGFRGVLDSTVPVGSGLSSSAAVEMATSWALADPATPRPDPRTMAMLAQRGENQYVGVNCGIMDQFASAAGKAGHALLIDCATNVATPTPLPGGLALVVCDTSAPRSLDNSAYNARRRECEQGAAILAEREPGVRTLRDVDEDMLARNRDRLPEVVARRCEHIVAENRRVLATVEALREGDLPELGRLFAASHASLRDLFEVSCPELDAMVEIATAVPGVVASRMTGGGFGGCTISLVESGAEEALSERVMREYPRRVGLTPKVYAVSAVDGAGPLSETL